MKQPRIIISGLAGGSGKTLAALALTRAFVRRGLIVQPCKKGPDYIDAAWLALAARRPCANLDPYFLPPRRLREQFLRACRAARSCGISSEDSAHLAIIEGNRGLYDGRDVHGSCSTAQVAVTLDAPVLLVLNCAKMTRTAAALVKGAVAFADRTRLAGVLINNTGSERHAAQVRQALETHTSLPVLGVLPRLPENPLPERHMGLALRHAAPEQEAVLDRLAEYATRHIDLEKLLRIARSAPNMEETAAGSPRGEPVWEGTRPRIGFVRDNALWFYYEENLEALRLAGAELTELSLFASGLWPELDGLYLGGGFPEAHAADLAASPHLSEIRALSEAGRPVYAECGGLMILGQALAMPLDQGVAWHTMAGLLPVRTRFFSRPQGLGYVKATVLRPNPFHPVGSVWRGHEFHYSRCEAPVPPEQDFLLRLSPGTGMSRAPDGSGLDGLCLRRTFASYTHLFAPAVPHWAENFVRAAQMPWNGG